MSAKRAERRRAERERAERERAEAAAATRRRRLVVAALAAVLAVAAAIAIVLTSDQSQPGAPVGRSASRPVTEEEANRLAVARFQNYRATGAHFRTQVSSAEGPLALEGDIDFREQVGYAKIRGAGGAFTLQWNDATLLAWPASATGSAPPAKLSARKPVSRPLAPAKSTVDSVLAVLLGLGQDRPDNAQLIRRNNARWLRSAMIGKTKVDVLQGPAATGQGTGSGAAVRYWLDARGRLLRVDAFLGGGSRATTINLDAAAFKTFPRSAKLASSS